MVDFEIIVRRLRTITGCFLFFYAVTHLLNHSLGLISLEVMELGRSVFLKFWNMMHPIPISCYGFHGTYVPQCKGALMKCRGSKGFPCELHDKMWLFRKICRA